MLEAGVHAYMCVCVWVGWVCGCVFQMWCKAPPQRHASRSCLNATRHLGLHTCLRGHVSALIAPLVIWQLSDKTRHGEKEKTPASSFSSHLSPPMTHLTSTRWWHHTHHTISTHKVHIETLTHPHIHKRWTHMEKHPFYFCKYKRCFKGKHIYRSVNAVINHFFLVLFSIFWGWRHV